MLIETVILYSCIKGLGCSQSTSAYYLYNKDVREVAQRAQQIADPFIKENKWLVYVVTPIYSATSGKVASFALTKNTALNLNIKGSYVGLQWNY